MSEGQQLKSNAEGNAVPSLTAYVLDMLTQANGCYRLIHSNSSFWRAFLDIVYQPACPVDILRSEFEKMPVQGSRTQCRSHGLLCLVPAVESQAIPFQDGSCMRRASVRQVLEA